MQVPVGESSHEEMSTNCTHASSTRIARQELKNK